MSIIEVETLVAPVSAESPAGALIQYAEDVELEMLATRIAERAIGADNEPGARRLAAIEPDWQEVEQRARALLVKSKDVRFVVILVRALCNQHGVVGLSTGLNVTRAILERYWDCLHPGLDDMEARMNQIAGLFDTENLKRDLRERVFFRSPGIGVVLVRDVEAAVARYPARAEAPALSEEQMRNAFVALDTQEQERIARSVTGALDEIRILAELWTEKVQTARAPDMRVLTQILRSLNQIIPTVDQEAELLSVAPTAAGTPAIVSGHSELLRRLDEVCDYLEQHEPSNPAPLLIKRAKALIGKDFMQIMQDLAPTGMDQVCNLAGIRE